MLSISRGLKNFRMIPKNIKVRRSRTELATLSKKNDNTEWQGKRDNKNRIIFLVNGAWVV